MTAREGEASLGGVRAVEKMVRQRSRSWAQLAARGVMGCASLKGPSGDGAVRALMTMPARQVWRGYRGPPPKRRQANDRANILFSKKFFCSVLGVDVTPWTITAIDFLWIALSRRAKCKWLFKTVPNCEPCSVETRQNLSWQCYVCSTSKRYWWR